MSASGHVKGLADVCRDVVYRHVFANTDREVGGFLVGTVEEDRTTSVVAALEAVGAIESAGSLTFTHECWASLHKMMDELYPTCELVGWYHSHPGFGIYLSARDLFIHENFFARPTQFALVVDPLSCREGVFVWTDEGTLVGGTATWESGTPAEWPSG